MKNFQFHNLLNNYVTSPGPRYLLRLHLLCSVFNKYLLESSTKFLEIGAGNGDVTAFISDVYDDAHITIVDSSDYALEPLNQRFSDNHRVDILKIALEEYSPQTQFDFILSFEVLEHIQNDLSVIKAMNTLLHNDGLLIFSVPSYMSKWQSQDIASGHIRRYEEAEVIEKLNLSGFEIVELYDYGFPLTSIMRPFREIFYKDTGETLEEKTAASGVKKRIFSNKSNWVIAICLIPFFGLQRLFSKFRLGDGFIVIAKKKN